MVAASRCIGVASALATFMSASGLRMSRKTQEQTKYIAGTPVYNYHMAYDGQSFAEVNAASTEQDWIAVVPDGTAQADMTAWCALAKACKALGHAKGGVPFFEVRGTEDDLHRIVKSSDGAVSFFEPDTQESMIPEIQEMTPYSASWGLDRVAAGSRPSTKGRGVHVYVLDTGIRHTHRDFGSRAIATLDMSGGSTYECWGNSNCARDSQGHGTHCAGTVAGSSYGVAPLATLHSVKVLGDDGRGASSWSYSALDWLATRGDRPAVASMSLGSKGIKNGHRVAVDGAVAAGVTVVVASGNSEDDACGYSPAHVPSAITVGSTTPEDEPSWFSNYGKCVDMWAPGSGIVSASHTSNSGSSEKSGTSMACPHVSGGAALILANNKRLSPAGVLSELLGGAATNFIQNLRAGDTNKLLYVSAGGPPPAPAAPVTPAPLSCPSFADGPDDMGDCQCKEGACYEGGSVTCTYAYTADFGMRSRFYFSMGCTNCECK